MSDLAAVLMDKCPNCQSVEFRSDMVLTGNHFCTTDSTPKRLNPLDVIVDFEQGEETVLYQRGEPYPEIVYRQAPEAYLQQELRRSPCCH